MSKKINSGLNASMNKKIHIKFVYKKIELLKLNILSSKVKGISFLI